VRIVKGPGAAGAGGPVTLLVSLQEFKNRAASIKKKTVTTMFSLEG